MSRPNSATPAAEQLAPLNAQETDALFALFDSYSSLLLAVSGGSDSMALLYLVNEWRSRQIPPPVGGRSGGGRQLRRDLDAPTLTLPLMWREKHIVVASVDHRLRVASAGECRFVAEFCKARNIPHIILDWEGAKPVTAIQQTARDMRYTLLAQAARTEKCDAIVTAHTLDDQAETVLMRLVRGSGLSGLQGMAPVFEKNGVPLLRPFLTVRREKLRATLRAQNLSWCEDASNSDARFLRPRLRRLLPLLAEEGLDAPRLGKIAHKIARANRALDSAAETLLVDTSPRRGEVRRGALVPCNLDAPTPCLRRSEAASASRRQVTLPLWGRENKIERSAYRAAPEEIRLRFLRKIIASLAAPAYPPADEALEALDAALMNEKKPRRTLGNVLFSAGERTLRFRPENDPRKTGRV